ncbi:helix-turn-helix domain-containing protein [Chromobacterium vaccinii]|uniref:helix-turn-helix domain-containing protein n=1 Tax=Chromobacterium vaccinii TaxID=1108595 RepID=UPI003C763D90
MSENSFHSRLLAIMKARGIKQNAVSQALDVSRHTVRRWCKSKMPDRNQLATLAAYLDVTVSHLVNGDPMDPNHAARCQRLHALATALHASDVDAMIQLAESILATKMLQK